MSSTNFLCQSLGLKTFNCRRDDKFKTFHQCDVENLSDEKVHKIKYLGKIDDYVYDIETETHDFNCGFPLILRNTDSFVLSVNTKNIMKDLLILGDIFDFSDLDGNHELFGYKNKKVNGIFKRETPKNIWINEFNCLRSKAYSFKCKSDDESKSKLKGISKSQCEHIRCEENKTGLHEEDYQRERDNYIIRSLNHEMYLQKIKKNTLSIFDDKRCYESNIGSKLWE